MRGKIYFDISDILLFAKHHDRVSGIQRVVFSLLAELSALQKDGHLHLIACHPSFNTMMVFSSNLFSMNGEYSAQVLRDHFFLDLRLALPALAANPLLFVNHAVTYRKVRWALHSGRSFTHQTHHGRASKKSVNVFSPPRLAPDDIIFLPGAFWGIPQFQHFLQEQKTRGVKIYTFIHDLIPLVLPETVDGKTSEIFDRDLRTFAALTTRFIANSQSTRRDLERFMDALPLARRPAVTTVKLAHEFPAATREPTPQHAVKPEGEYVLCVGTMESRKNHINLVKAWIELHRRLKQKTPQLVLAGRFGWKIDELKDLLKTTGNVGGHVTIHENLSDQEIGALYEHCLFTIYPSLYEGWGLPVGESLWHGKTCVTSNVSALPEVGGDLCIYADPHDPHDICLKVLDLVRQPKKRSGLEQKIARTKLRSWADVAADINRELERDRP